MNSFIKLPFNQIPVLQSAGRAGNHFERTDPNDRNEWNSDDEDVDEFGRRKKRKIATKITSRDGATDEAPHRAGDAEGFAKASGSTMEQSASSSINAPQVPFAQAMFPTHLNLAQLSVPPKSAGMMPRMAVDASARPPRPMQGLKQMQDMLQQMVSGNYPVPKPKSANWAPPNVDNAQENAQRPKMHTAKPWNTVTMVPCQFFQQGTCARGDSCMFLHTGKGGVADCKFFAMGQCARGSACSLRHFRGFAPESSFVDFETGLPKGASADKAPKEKAVSPKATTSIPASPAQASDAGEDRVNMDEALEELLSMV